jgi:signal transduction histidine kinase
MYFVVQSEEAAMLEMCNTAGFKPGLGRLPCRNVRMRMSIWLQDTIARRFAITVILAVGVAMVLVTLFNRFGGTWSQEPLEKTGLLNEAADMFRVVGAAPAPLRATLCAAATTSNFRLDWYTETSDVSLALAALGKTSDGEIVERIRASTHHAAVAFSPARARAIPSGLIYDHTKGKLPYVLAIELGDRSWVAFSVVDRSWGLPPRGRWAIRIACLAAAITLVTAIASRQFAKPVERLADAVRQFGNNPQAPPIDEVGPKELRQVISIFNHMRSQIQTFVAHRTTMLAAISHDLRTPLTRIRLRGELIEDREQQARLFRDVDEMQAMVGGALAFFRDDAFAEDTTTLDLPHVIIATINDYADQDINITYDGPVHGRYQGRPLALKRALTNLIENAIKYGTTPEVGLARSQTSWSITVKDRGPGIPDDSLDSVFRPYHRLGKSGNRTTGGVGLGLTVAQAIVHGHGGTIVLSNREGGGLEARVILPIDATLVHVKIASSA